MYAVPGLPLSAVLDPTLAPEKKAQLLALTTVLKSLMSSVNVSVWCPSENKMVFALTFNKEDEI
jgi:hypothetical protein